MEKKSPVKLLFREELKKEERKWGFYIYKSYLENQKLVEVYIAPNETIAINHQKHSIEWWVMTWGDFYFTIGNGVREEHIIASLTPVSFRLFPREIHRFKAGEKGAKINYVMANIPEDSEFIV